MMIERSRKKKKIHSNDERDELSSRAGARIIVGTFEFKGIARARVKPREAREKLTI